MELVDRVTGRAVQEHETLQLQARSTRGTLWLAGMRWGSPSTDGHKSEQHLYAPPTCPLPGPLLRSQLCVVDRREWEAVAAAAGAGGAVPDADLDRIALLANQQARLAPALSLGWRENPPCRLRCRGLEPRGLCAKVPSSFSPAVPHCPSLGAQGKPLLAAKHAPSDGRGFVTVPLAGGSALLPELSITGGRGSGVEVPVGQ